MKSKLTTQARFLSELVKKHDLKVGAELGVYQGKTSLHLLENHPELKMYLIDIWNKIHWLPKEKFIPGSELYVHYDQKKNEKMCRSGCLKYGKRATIFKAVSWESATFFPDNFLDFVFIDAVHSEEGVARDIMAFYPKVKVGGWITGHDLHFPAVELAVKELLGTYEEYDVYCWYHQKQSEDKPWNENECRYLKLLLPSMACEPE